MRICWSAVAAVILTGCIHTAAFGQKTGFELELDKQELEVLPEPPAAVTAETTRLVFGIAPVRTSGLLTNQLENSIRALTGSLNRARFVHLRAFVAGSGDSRRVQEVVGEIFQDRKRPLPSLSVIQVGALGIAGAQVVIEYVAEDRRPQNPGGIAFVSSGVVSASDQSMEAAPLVSQAVERIRSEIGRPGGKPPKVLRATCYCSSLADPAAVRRVMLGAFPGAAVNQIQTRRSYTQGSVTCEAAVRMPESAVETAVSEEGPAQMVVLGPGRSTFTGAQLAFRTEDADIQLAFQRLGKVLEENDTSLEHVVKWNIFPLSLALNDRIQELGAEFVDKARPPVTVLAEAEGLPALDASFAVDMVATQ